MARTVAGSSIIWMGVAILVAVYAGWLSQQVDAANERAVDARQREQALVQQLQQVAVQAGTRRDRASSAGRDEALTVALLRRPDLIPFEGEVGGTFYFLEDTLEVLSDRYLYVGCEDGHVACHMLIAFDRAGDGFEFEVIDAYRD